MEALHAIIGSILPFDWAAHAFMKNALIAVMIIAPILGMLGTMVISNRMAFFSDALGHASLTGVAIGVMAGMADPIWAMICFAVIAAVGITIVKHYTMASADTVIGVFSSSSVALGIVLLSRAGGFARWSTYLIGDVLSIGPGEIVLLAAVAIAVLAAWIAIARRLVLVGLNPTLAMSRGVPARVVDGIFTVMVAVVVTVSIRWIGLLLINAFLVLPAAAARNLSRSMRAYLSSSIAVALVSGVAGLVLSYYAETATGATIVILLALFYAATASVRFISKRE